MDHVDCVVVGAGVIGLALARSLAMRGAEVLLLEREHAFGTGISARNSEVIHAGIYYPTDSMKARLCVTGRRQLYAYCEEYGIPHRRLGKLIVATSGSQEARLRALMAQAQENGVESMSYLEANQCRLLEPALQCQAALFSPETGIVDSQALMQSLLGQAEDHGALLATHSECRGAEIGSARVALTINADSQPTLSCRLLFNCAGLDAIEFANRMTGSSRAGPESTLLAKGHYFSLEGRCPFSRLIYPLPDDDGLGIHLTLDLGGQARFGPDVEWVDAVDYSVDPARAASFYQAIRRYWPGLPEGRLTPAFAGIRPKLGGPNHGPQDFCIDTQNLREAHGVVNLLGIESPGLTSALAIADQVRQLLEVRDLL